MRVLGTKSTTYSAPRYSSVCPRCRPNPLTSVTVMPDTPISESAARTSSSLKGLMMAVINFILDSGLEGRRHNTITIAVNRHGHLSSGSGDVRFDLCKEFPGDCPFRARPEPL